MQGLAPDLVGTLNCESWSVWDLLNPSQARTGIFCASQAAHSLGEGMEETLTLHRLGLASVLGRSLQTANIIENVSHLDRRIRRVMCWVNSNQCQRWVAMAIRETEPRLGVLRCAEHVPKLQKALSDSVSKPYLGFTSNRLRPQVSTRNGTMPQEVTRRKGKEWEMGKRGGDMSRFLHNGWHCSAPALVWREWRLEPRCGRSFFSAMVAIRRSRVGACATLAVCI